MSKPSNWPLSQQSARVVAPVVMRERLQNHPLSQDCFPLAVGYYETAAEHQMKRGRHDDNILIYCFAGQGALTTQHWEGPVNEGELVLLPSGVDHDYRASEDDPWSIYWCHFSGLRSQDYLYNMDYRENQPTRRIGESPHLKAQFQALLSEAASGYNERALIHAANMLKQLLTYTAKLLLEKDTDDNRFSLDKVQAYMLQHLDQSIDLETLAELAHLSKYHFSKRYREATGFSPIQHLIQMKVEYARYLLETSNLSIQDIAFRVGYDDNLYFSRVFARATGMSPRAYRKHSASSKASDR